MLFPVCYEAVAFNSGIWLVMLFPLGLLAFSLVYATSQGLWFEMAIERTWKRVCVGIGFKSEARSYKHGFIGAYRDGETKIITPRLRDVHGNYESWTGNVQFFDGQTVEQYSEKSANFALAFHVPFVTFEVADSGLIVVRAGKVPVPTAFDFSAQLQASEAVNNRPLIEQRMTVDELMQTLPEVNHEFGYKQQVPKVVNAYARELELLKAVPMARDMNGRECKIPIEGQHWLIAARSGSGKSSWIWSLVLGLSPAWRAGFVRFLGCDPKRVELAIGRGWWDEYADTTEDIVALLEKAVDELLKRGSQLQGRVRKFTPSRDTPLNVIVIDELAYVTAFITDKKLRERADRAMQTILALGRWGGYAICAAVQDPRKETVGFRDLFQIRIAGAMPAPMVDLCLGEGMHDAGATCEQLPLGDAGAGVAYVISETTMKPIKVRAAWCSDEDIQGMLVRSAPRPVIDAGCSMVKDENLSGQLDWNGQPLRQFRHWLE